MGKGLQLVTGYVPSSTGSGTFDAATPAPNDLFAVNDYTPGSEAWLINAWVQSASVTRGRIRSPNFHDDVNGITLLSAANSPIPLMDGYSRQLLQKNDLLTVEVATATASELANIVQLHYYENLPGADASLFRWPEIEPRIKELMTTKVTCTAAGTDGAYEGAAGMTSVQNLFKSEGLYALLGYTASLNLTAVGITGTDTSNRRIGGPGTVPDVFDTREWFVKQSMQTGLPTICVFRTQNLQSTVVDIVDNGDVADSGVDIEFLFARLSA